MLRSFFIGLSTNKPFRKFSERSSLGSRVSHRFVDGMTIEVAITSNTSAPAEEPELHPRPLLLPKTSGTMQAGSPSPFLDKTLKPCFRPSHVV